MSASVNSVTGLWICYACGARGKAGVKTPTVKQLTDMLEQEPPPRIYSDLWLENFMSPGYWEERYPDDFVRQVFGLGIHPISAMPSFPVMDFQGHILGCGVRTDSTPKYLYPRGWKASQSFGRPLRSMVARYGLPIRASILVEGITDAVALAEANVNALACWGASLHKPQADKLAARGITRLLIGFDNDEAGDRGFQNIATCYAHMFEIYRIIWAYKDASEEEVGDRWWRVLHVLPPQCRLSVRGEMEDIQRQWFEAREAWSAEGGRERSTLAPEYAALEGPHDPRRGQVTKQSAVQRVFGPTAGASSKPGRRRVSG